MVYRKDKNTHAMRIKFCDLNNNLVEKVRRLGIEAVCGDYFLEACKTERPVLMTASNPMWTFGGGIDRLFKDNFPYWVSYKQIKGGDMERIGSVCFCITVDENIRSTKEQVKKAIEFAIENTDENETLLLSGVGTGIGGLSEDDFVEVLSTIK